MSVLKTITRHGWIAYLLGLGVVVVDQLSKLWVLHGLDLARKGHIELSPIFDLTLVWNRGMSFGFLAGHGEIARWGFTVFAFVIAGAVGWWARKNDKMSLAVTFGLLIGGAIGNAIDRIRIGAVVDFLDFSGLGFQWVFNVADSAITIGAVLIAVEAFWPSVRQRLESVRVRGN